MAWTNGNEGSSNAPHASKPSKDVDFDTDTDDLCKLGHVVSSKRVAKLLKTQGLKAIQPKSFQPKTTDSRHRLGYSPNLLLDENDPVRLNQLWIGDITHIPLT